MEAVLDAVRREGTGKNIARRLRADGRIPATVYGGAGGGSESVAVDPKSLLRILHSQSGVNTLIALRVEGQPDTIVLVKEYQVHPVEQRLLHADFYRIAMDKAIEVTVPVQLVGEAKGVKAQGGIVDFVHREIEIECLPGDIPEHVTIDVTEMALHDAVRVRDLPTGGKWTPLSDADMLIVHIVAPRVEVEEAPAEEVPVAPVAAAEPEVIKKGKAEKDEEKE